MTWLETKAAEMLRSHGYTVLPPPEPPPVGSVWTPRRTDALPREVRWVDAYGLAYRLPGGWEGRCMYSTWAAWVRRTRAEVVG